MIEIDFLAKSFKKTSLWEAHKDTPVSPCALQIGRVPPAN